MRGFERLTLTAADLVDVARLNRLRGGASGQELLDLERRICGELRAGRHLAVYGSLAPGRENHGQLQDLAGEWHDGYAVRGELVASGWGATLGYPALRWSMNGPAVPVLLFASDDLEAHWPRLDRFEGPEYLRIVAPLFDGDDCVGLANLFAAAP